MLAAQVSPLSEEALWAPVTRSSQHSQLLQQGLQDSGSSGSAGLVSGGQVRCRGVHLWADSALPVSIGRRPQSGLSWLHGVLFPTVGLCPASWPSPHCSSACLLPQRTCQGLSWTSLRPLW
jgi:hypothetical protein